MGLFGFGKKKKKLPEAAKETAQPAPRYDGEPQLRTYTPPEHLDLIYDEILSKMPDAERDGQGIVFPEQGLRLTAQVQRLNGANDRFSAEMLFVLHHAFFDEPLCEYVAGIGDTAEQAIQRGTEQFWAVVLLSVLAAFGCTGDHIVETELLGEKYRFRRTCTTNILSMGAENPVRRDMWELVENEIPKYLGRKKAYWVKLFACCINGEYNNEVRVNGAVFPELTEVLDAYVSTWENTEAFHSEKEFLLLLREGELPDDGLRSAEIIDLTAAVCPMLAKIRDDASNEKIMRSIYALCGGDSSLAWNMRNFIPEVCASIITSLKMGDSCTINCGEKDSIEVMYSQIKSYGYIEQGVMKYLNESKPSQNEVLRIAGLSAVLGIVQQLSEKNVDKNSVKPLRMVYNAFDGYEIR